MTFKLELPTNDPLVLNEIGLALTRIAKALMNDGTSGITTDDDIESKVAKLEAVVQPIDTVTDKKLKPDLMICDDVAETTDIEPPAIDESPAATVEEITQAEVNAGNIKSPTEPDAATVFANSESNVLADIGSDGIPWDKRIHSREKTKNADGTFKLRRKSKDYATKDLWLAFIAGVKQELISAMSAPTPATTENVAPPHVANIPPPPATTENVAPPATKIVTPPPVVNNVTTFQQLMLLITTNSKKITKDQVNKIINDAGLPGANPVALCATRTDLIPAIAAQIMVITNG